MIKRDIKSALESMIQENKENGEALTKMYEGDHGWILELDQQISEIHTLANKLSEFCGTLDEELELNRDNEDADWTIEVVHLDNVQKRAIRDILHWLEQITI